jgi:HAD superfamily hydrolase (TIGR01509 family)
MKFAAVLFDCDGILVDSEAITIGVLRDLLSESGWEMTVEQCMQVFLGRLVRDNAKLIEERTGKPMSKAWMDNFLDRRDQALTERLTAVDGIHDALAAISKVYGKKIACASGADRRKIELQLTKVGLIDHFVGRYFSGFEMPQSKPAPDVYLAAAAALGVDARDCAIIEDSPTGAQAGLAAGGTVFGFVDAHALSVRAMGGIAHARSKLEALGVPHLFHAMHELPALLV